MSNESDNLISKMIGKAVDKSGLTTIFMVLLVFGLASLWFDIVTSTSLAIVALAVFGILEFFHRDAKTTIHKIRQPIYDNNTLFMKFLSSKKICQPKIFEEFLYEGLGFKTVGFMEIPSPLTITGPLCPRCQDKMIESVGVVYPGFTSIIFKCVCGFSKKSNRTKSEIIYEISEFKGLPSSEDSINKGHKYLSP